MAIRYARYRDPAKARRVIRHAVERDKREVKWVAAFLRISGEGVRKIMRGDVAILRESTARRLKALDRKLNGAA